MPVFRTNLKAIGNLFLTNGHIKFSIPTFGVFLFKIFNLHILCSLFSVHCLLLRKFMNCLYYHYFVHKFTQIFAQIFSNFILTRPEFCLHFSRLITMFIAVIFPYFWSGQAHPIHSDLCSPFPVLSSLFSVPSSQFSVLSSQFSVLSSQFSVPS